MNGEREGNLVMAGDRLNGLIKSAQEIVNKYMLSESGISEHDCLGELIGILDGQQQRTAQHQWELLRRAVHQHYGGKPFMNIANDGGAGNDNGPA